MPQFGRTAQFRTQLAICCRPSPTSPACFSMGKRRASCLCGTSCQRSADSRRQQSACARFRLPVRRMRACARNGRKRSGKPDWLAIWTGRLQPANVPMRPAGMCPSLPNDGAAGDASSGRRCRREAPRANTAPARSARRVRLSICFSSGRPGVASAAEITRRPTSLTHNPPGVMALPLIIGTVEPRRPQTFWFGPTER